MAECICGICSKTFSVKPSYIKKGKGKYCSLACYAVAQNMNIECKCLTCGKSFKVKPVRLKMGGGKYCSIKCQHSSLESKIECRCLNCDKTFNATPARIERGEGKYCSRNCLFESKKTKVKSTCLCCGKSFETLPSQLSSGRAIYCSKECHIAHQQGQNHHSWLGGKQDYRGPNWNSQRKVAYKRDGGICQICHFEPKPGERRNSVHHIKPYREFNGDHLAANDLSNLITLCSTCHPRAEHGLLAVPRRLL